MAIKLPDSVKKILQDKAYGHVITFGAGGKPQVTMVWVDIDGDEVVFNTAEGRLKPKNLRSDPRVIVLEKVNARSLSHEHIPELVDLCAIDVSFISLTLILPNAFDLLAPAGLILALIKPQFELQRSDVGKGGIVRDPGLHQKAQDKIVAFVTRLGHMVIGTVPAAITGADGNQEFFACMRKQSA